MASGHASRINRPNTWPLRPDLRREESSCQHGAVHTWHTVIIGAAAATASGLPTISQVVFRTPLEIFSEPFRVQERVM